ncbi:hypothetical protein [Rhodoferax sp.]|uniref:hypothetical protein n=1 Tax=Rhodoferax sp. TaxID=50421 RepID=UPI00374DE177
MNTNYQKVIGLFLLSWLLATITIGMQTWIGDQTIYSKQLEKQREELHFGILENKAPGGKGWTALGATSIQKRIGIVYLAEAIRINTGLTVAKIYKLLDTAFLFVGLLALYFYLKKWLPDPYSLLGVLYFCAMLPLTYLFQLFHPWDRLQMVFWIGLLYLVAEGNFVVLVFCLFLSVLVKFDTILLPFLYFLVHVNRSGWLKTSMETLFLLLITFGTYMALGQLFPSPVDGSYYNLQGAFNTLWSNAQKLVEMNVRYPPLLVHALPVFLALFFLPSKHRFVVASVAFALGLSAVYMVFSNYEEVRAHMVVLVLVLPSALLTLKKLVDGAPSNGSVAAD